MVSNRNPITSWASPAKEAEGCEFQGLQTLMIPLFLWRKAIFNYSSLIFSASRCFAHVTLTSSCCSWCRTLLPEIWRIMCQCTQASATFRTGKRVKNPGRGGVVVAAEGSLKNNLGSWGAFSELGQDWGECVMADESCQTGIVTRRTTPKTHSCRQERCRESLPFNQQVPDLEKK